MDDYKSLLARASLELELTGRLFINFLCSINTLNDFGQVRRNSCPFLLQFIHFAGSFVAASQVGGTCVGLASPIGGSGLLGRVGL